MCDEKDPECVIVYGLLQDARVVDSKIEALTNRGLQLVVASDLDQSQLPHFRNEKVFNNYSLMIPKSPGGETMMQRGMWVLEGYDYKKELAKHLKTKNGQWLQEGLFEGPDGKLLSKITKRLPIEQAYLNKLYNGFDQNYLATMTDKGLIEIVRADDEGTIYKTADGWYFGCKYAPAMKVFAEFKPKSVWTLRQMLHYIMDDPQTHVDLIFAAVQEAKQQDRARVESESKATKFTFGNGKSVVVAHTRQHAGNLDSILIATDGKRLKCEFVGPRDCAGTKPVGLRASMKDAVEYYFVESAMQRFADKLKAEDFGVMIDHKYIKSKLGKRQGIPFLSSEAIHYIFEKKTGLTLEWYNAKPKQANPRTQIVVDFRNQPFQKLQLAMISIDDYFCAMVTHRDMQFTMDPDQTRTWEHAFPCKFPFPNKFDMSGWFSLAFLLWVWSLWTKDDGWGIIYPDDFVQGPSADDVKNVLREFEGLFAPV